MGGANIQPLGLVATAIFFLAAVLVSTSGQLEVGGCAFFVGISAVLKKPYPLELYYLFYLVLLFKLWYDVELLYLVLALSSVYLYD